MPLLYYLQTNVFCILILLIIYFALRNRTGTIPAQRIVFGRLLLTTVVLCVADSTAWWLIGSEAPGAGIILKISNAVYFSCITLAGYIWLCYVELRVRDQNFNFRRQRRITAIPLLIMLLIIGVNLVIPVLYSIDENNIYTRGKWVFLHWVISWFYLIYAMLEVIRKIRESASRAERDRFLPMLWFTVCPAVAAALQMFVYGITSTIGGITFGALIVAVNYLMDEISKDTLTGLNNRRTLEKTMAEVLQRTNTKVTVFMCDIDKFKSINDTLGHFAGDMVLRRMSEALKKSCGEFEKRLFLCRYGGDEFVICGMDLEEVDAERLIQSVKSNIESVNSENEKNLRFGISIGTASDVCRNYADIERLIQIADKSMYEKKHSGRRK